MAKRKKVSKIKKDVKDDGSLLEKSIRLLMPIPQKTNSAWIIINLTLIAGIIYGIYRIIYKDWSQGLSIIVLFLIIILVIKLILKLKRSKKR